MIPNGSQILIVGFGGFLGAIVRFGVAQFIRTSFPTFFPVSTLFINVSGSLAIGLFYEAMKNSAHLQTLSLFLAVGFLGAFTTFSTFSFETIQLLREGAALHALINVGSSVLMCLSSTYVGIVIGSHFQSFFHS